MTWRIKQAKRISHNGAAFGVRVIFENPDELDNEGKPQQREMNWGVGSQNFGQFRKMLIGTGSVRKPKGELKVWLDHLNSKALTEADL